MAQASRLVRLKALARSIALYHATPRRFRHMTDLYRRFVTPGDLVFDIGAHVGDRVRAFRKLGARVVAVEPQPDPYRFLTILFGRDPDVALVRAAVSDAAGRAMLHVNSANPTVSTLSEAFVAAADGADGWHEQRWDDAMRVDTLTLDDLIADHGRPAFVKIDVEGHEDAVLGGLTQVVPAVSVEFTTLQRHVAHRALDRLDALGPYRYGPALGETHRLVRDTPMTGREIRAWLDALPDAANSGDIYAWRA